MSPAPIRLESADAARYARLRLRMLTESPWAFSENPDDDIALVVAHLAEVLTKEQNAILAVEAASADSAAESTGEGRTCSELVGAAGILRMEQTKFAHRARIWGVFVAPDHRGRGIGRAVVTAAVDLARSWPGVEYVDLGVSENSPALFVFTRVSVFVSGAASRKRRRSEDGASMKST